MARVQVLKLREHSARAQVLLHLAQNPLAERFRHDAETERRDDRIRLQDAALRQNGTEIFGGSGDRYQPLVVDGRAKVVDKARVDIEGVKAASGLMRRSNSCVTAPVPTPTSTIEVARLKSMERSRARAR